MRYIFAQLTEAVLIHFIPLLGENFCNKNAVMFTFRWSACSSGKLARPVNYRLQVALCQQGIDMSTVGIRIQQLCDFICVQCAVVGRACALSPTFIAWYSILNQLALPLLLISKPHQYFFINLLSSVSTISRFLSSIPYPFRSLFCTSSQQNLLASTKTPTKPISSCLDVLVLRTHSPRTSPTKIWRTTVTVVIKKPKPKTTKPK